MSQIAIRHVVVCLAACCLLLTSGCCGVCGIFGMCGRAKYNSTCYPPCPPRACYGLAYCGQCTCDDDWRDLGNQLSDIFLP